MIKNDIYLLFSQNYAIIYKYHVVLHHIVSRSYIMILLHECMIACNIYELCVKLFEMRSEYNVITLFITHIVSYNIS